jgi:hypothetical protein
MHSGSALEPIVHDASTVAWQVFKRVQAIKVIDWYVCDGPWIGQAQIDRNAATTLFIDLLTSPKGHAATRWTKVKLKCLAPCEKLSLARDLNAFVFVVVSPKYSIPPARRAIACRCSIRVACKLPLHRSTEARSFKHGSNP